MASAGGATSVTLGPVTTADAGLGLCSNSLMARPASFHVFALPGSPTSSEKQVEKLERCRDPGRSGARRLIEVFCSVGANSIDVLVAAGYREIPIPSPEPGYF